MNGIAELVDQVTDGLSQLRQLLDDPSALPLATITLDIARLERAMDKKAYVDAAFAQACVLADAGKLVGANHPDAYLTEKLGISRGEAYNRLARAKALFDAPPPPEPDLGDLFDAEDGSEEDRSAAEEAARKAADEEAERRRKDQEEARKRADEVPAAKQDIIRRELDKLLKAAEGERMRIYARAMEQAKYRDEKDLRLFVKRLVAEANKPHVKANPNAGFEKRDASLGRENSDGTFDVTLSMTRADYALYKALTDAVRAGRMQPLSVEKLDGGPAFSLKEYGATATHKGAKIGGRASAPPKRRGRSVAEALGELDGNEGAGPTFDD